MSMADVLLSLVPTLLLVAPALTLSSSVLLPAISKRQAGSDSDWLFTLERVLLWKPIRTGVLLEFPMVRAVQSPPRFVFLYTDTLFHIKQPPGTNVWRRAAEAMFLQVPRSEMYVFALMFLGALLSCWLNDKSKRTSAAAPV